MQFPMEARTTQRRSPSRKKKNGWAENLGDGGGDQQVPLWGFGGGKDDTGGKTLPKREASHFEDKWGARFRWT